MKHLILTLCSPLAISASHAAESQAPDAPGRWTAEKARQWYDSQPWPCFHSYGDPEKVADLIAKLKPHGRPIINTEWLNRPGGSSVEGCLPLFAAENVGCMHWGLVNGRSQTHLRWGARPGQPEPEKWQGDLFHGDHTPYARAEIDLFKKTIATSRK